MRAAAASPALEAGTPAGRLEALLDGSGAARVLSYALDQDDVESALIRANNWARRYARAAVDLKDFRAAELVAEDPELDPNRAEQLADEWFLATYADVYAEFVRVQEAVIKIARTAATPGKVRAAARGLPYVAATSTCGLRQRQRSWRAMHGARPRERGCRPRVRARGRERRARRATRGSSRAGPSDLPDGAGDPPGEHPDLDRRRSG
jgi:hypothetical protein